MQRPKSMPEEVVVAETKIAIPVPCIEDQACHDEDWEQL